MADKKYEKQLDRMATLHDAKIRIIDLMENGFELPETGIYDEPVRYFKANLKWTPIIFGWLTWLQDVAAWREAEGEDYRGITEIMIFEEGIELPMSIDYEALQAAIKAGMYDMVNDVAKQIVSGRTTNISVDDEGSVSDPTDGTASEAELPEDDPETSIDETNSAKMGGVIEVGKAVELFLDKVDAYYGSVNGTPVFTADETKTFINSYFPTDETRMNDAITAYYLWRSSNNRILFDGTNSFYQFLYCKGYDEQGVMKWFIDASGYPANKIQIVSYLLDGLLPAFFNGYFEDGTAKPSTSYLDAACVPIPFQTLENMVFAVARSTTIVKAQHRMKFKITGYALDVDGDIQDAMWYRTAAGVLTRSNWSFVHSAGSNLPSDNQVPYNTNHVYEYTIDLANLGGNPIVITPNKNAGMNAVGLTYPTPFTIELTDLGEYAV